MILDMCLLWYFNLIVLILMVQQLNGFLHVVMLRYQLEVKTYSRTLHICSITLYILTTSDHMYVFSKQLIICIMIHTYIPYEEVISKISWYVHLMFVSQITIIYVHMYVHTVGWVIFMSKYFVGLWLMVLKYFKTSLKII